MIPGVTPDYSPKNLQVCFSIGGEDSGRGIIYNPDLVSKDSRARRICEEFSARGTHRYIGLSTRQGPGELARALSTKFRTSAEFIIGGHIAQLRATPAQAAKILEDIRKNPTSLYESPERLAN